VNVVRIDSMSWSLGVLGFLGEVGILGFQYFSYKRIFISLKSPPAPQFFPIDSTKRKSLHELVVGVAWVSRGGGDSRISVFFL
jgi:hypothetical protein